MTYGRSGRAGVMLFDWLEIAWNVNKKATPKKRKQAGSAGTAARPPRASPTADFDLAKAATAMMWRAAFDTALQG